MVSDSQYLVRGMREWVPGWAGRGWRRKEGPIENLELWQALLASARRHEVQWTWVRGHRGHPKNEYANDLAVLAAREQRISDGLVESGFEAWLVASGRPGSSRATTPTPISRRWRRGSMTASRSRWPSPEARGTHVSHPTTPDSDGRPCGGLRRRHRPRRPERRRRPRSGSRTTTSKVSTTAGRIRRIDTVRVGGTVTWTWVEGGEYHSVEPSAEGAFAPSEVLIGTGQTYSVTFAHAGTFRYECGVHGFPMIGTIVVR